MVRSNDALLDFLEYVRLEMGYSQEIAINRWAAEFQRRRAAFRYDDCHLLLAGVRSFEERWQDQAQAIIWHCQGGLLHQLQQWEEAIERYQLSLAAFREAGNLLGEGQVSSDLGNIYQALGRWPEAAACYEVALPAKRQFAQPGDLAATLNNVAVNQADLGNPAAALKTLHEALVLYGRLENQEGIGQTLINQGNFLWRLGELDEAEAAYQAALAALATAQVRWEVASALNGLGNVLRRRGKLAEAMDVYSRSLAAAQEVGDLTRQEQAVGNMGLVEQARGRFPEARLYFQQALELCRELDDQTGAATWLINLGLLLGIQRQEAASLPFFEQALALARHGRNPASEGAALLNIGNVYRNTGRFAKADQCYQESLQIARRLNDGRLEARLFSCLGSLHNFQGRTADVEPLFQQALEAYGRCGDVYGQAEVGYKLADWLEDAGKIQAAQEAAEQALGLAQQHGFFRLEMRLLGLLAGMTLRSGDSSGFALYAYAAARAQQEGEQSLLEENLTRLEEGLRLVAAHQPQAMVDVQARIYGVWQLEGWQEEVAELIAWAQRLIANLTCLPDNETDITLGS